MKLSNIFNVCYGSNLELCNVEETSPLTGVPFVSRTSANNGISAHIAKQTSNIKVNPRHSLSVALGGTVLETFYHDYEYYSGRDIAYLVPIYPLTREQMIYYALCIKSNKLKFSYGRQANRSLANLNMPDIDNIPEWALQTRPYCVTYQNSGENRYRLTNFIPILVDELFHVRKGLSMSVSDILTTSGSIPVISSSGKNNGVCGMTEVKSVFPAASLTLATNGSIGECFFHSYSFIATSDVTVLVPKFKLNQYQLLYIASLLRREGKTKYSYGRKWNINLVKNTKLKLPAISGNIDWDNISNFMMNIKNRYSIQC